MYLRGRYYLWDQMTIDANSRSLEYFNQVLEIDHKSRLPLPPCRLLRADGSNRLGVMKPFIALEKHRPTSNAPLNAMAEAHCTSGLIKSWYDYDLGWGGMVAGRGRQLSRSHRGTGSGPVHLSKR